MDRRDALKSLTSLAATAGLSVTPVTTIEAAEAELIILKVPGLLSQATADRLREYWLAVTEGTALEHVKCAIFSDGLQVEVIRRRA